MKIKLLLLLCVSIFSCKSLSPHFTRKEIKEINKRQFLNKEPLGIKKIDTVIVAKNGVGLYIFEYKKGNGEVLYPVIKLEDTYYLYDDNQGKRDKLYADFLDKYDTLFTETQLQELKRRFDMGVVVIGHL